MEMVIIGLLFILGAGVGSLVNARVASFRTCSGIQKKQTIAWSLGQAQNGRSKCDRCGHKLIWSDLVPILSYVVLRGKCRYCKQKISSQHILFELLAGCLFALSYMNLPIGWGSLAIWLAILSLFLALFLTDLYYRKLPTRLIVILVMICSVFSFITDVNIEQKMYSIWLFEHLLALIPLTGLFGLVYLFSKGKMIGFGDVLLGIPIAILLPWQGALAVLLTGSILAVLFYVILLVQKKIKSNTKIPFGSFLILATVVMEFFVNFF